MKTSTNREWTSWRGGEDAVDWVNVCEKQPQAIPTASLKTSPRLRHAALRDSDDLRFCSYGNGKHVESSPSLSTASYSDEDNSRPTRGMMKLAAMCPSLSRLSVVGPTPDLWNSQLFWLVLYFSFNLLLTLSNKSVLTGFPFPYTLTALHALCSTLGGLLLRCNGLYTPKTLGWREEMALATFSFLYSINVAVSNVSLHWVTVPFHQVVRAITPICTMFLSALLFNAAFSKSRLVSLAPVVFGVALATYGDYYFTFWGLVLTLFGTVLAALKTIFTNVLQSAPLPQRDSAHVPLPASWRHMATLESDISSFRRSPLVRILRQLVPPRLDIHPLDLLTRMSPLAFVQCVIFAQLSGELYQLRHFGAAHMHQADTPLVSALNASVVPGLVPLSSCEMRLIGGVTLGQALVLLLNGSIAFGLNVVSFSANGKVGPLSMTVAANVKQVLTILCAVSLFHLTITPMNALGITITLFGGAWYAWVEYTSKNREHRKQDGACH